MKDIQSIKGTDCRNSYDLKKNTAMTCNTAVQDLETARELLRKAFVYLPTCGALKVEIVAFLGDVPRNS